MPEEPNAKTNPTAGQNSTREEFRALCEGLNIKPEEVSSIRELDSKIKALDSGKTDGSPWLFRGEKYSDRLRTSLERAVRGFFSDLYQAPAIEVRTQREFMRRAHQYLAELPSSDNTLEWFSIMQHFGAPTRLLDWTYSIFVALYFAINRAVEDDNGYVVWAIQAEWIRKAANGIIGVGSDDDFLFQNFGETDNKFARLFYPSSPTWDKLDPLIYPANPLRLNERLTIQQGLFLCPRNLTLGFVENLKAMNPSAEILKAYTVVPNKRAEILLDLDRMNMSNATLFPGLQGFSESLWTKPICFFPKIATYDHFR